MNVELSGEWTREEVEKQLSKVLIQPEFTRNRSISKFLKFVVEETLEGRGERLKAFTIAVEALARDDTFDAQNSSIVRVQAARLRQLLGAYYAGEGLDDPIRIKMPVGGYKVLFEKTVNAQLRPEPVDEPAQPEACEPVPVNSAELHPSIPQRRLSDWRAGSFAAVALAGLLVLTVLLFFPQAERSSRPAPANWMTARPTLSVRVQTHSSSVNAVVQSLEDIVERGVSAFGDIVVTKPNMAKGSEPQDAYVVVINAIPSREDSVSLVFKLLHAASQVLVWSKDFAQIPVNGVAFKKIGSEVSQAIGDMNGAINQDMAARTRPWPDRPRGYICVLASYEAIRDRTPEKLRRASDCLEADIAADPENAYEQGMLAAILVRRYLDASPGHQGQEDLRRALRLARQAFDRDPQSARSAYFLFLTRFYDKRFDEAFAAGRRVLEINPNVGLFAAQIGASYVSRGDYERGEKLLEPMAKLDRAPPSFLWGFLCLAAYMKGDEETFLRLARMASVENGPIGLILQIIASQRVHDEQARLRAQQTLREKFPGVVVNIPAALDRYALAPQIVAKLTAELRTIEPTATK